MPLKGVSQVRGRYQAVIKDIAENKTMKVIVAIVAEGAANAKNFTPVDTSTMVNSQRKSFERGGTAVIGTVGYYSGFSKTGFSYQMHLETTDNWKPTKKASAKPHFLRSGFEDPDSQEAIKNIIRNGYKL